MSTTDVTNILSARQALDTAIRECHAARIQEGQCATKAFDARMLREDAEATLRRAERTYQWAILGLRRREDGEIEKIEVSCAPTTTQSRYQPS